MHSLLVLVALGYSRPRFQVRPEYAGRSGWLLRLLPGVGGRNSLLNKSASIPIGIELALSSAERRCPWRAPDWWPSLVMVRSGRLELPTFRFVAGCAIHLRHERLLGGRFGYVRTPKDCGSPASAHCPAGGSPHVPWTTRRPSCPLRDSQPLRSQVLRMAVAD